MGHGAYLHNLEQRIKDVLFAHPHYRPRASDKFQAKYKGKYSRHKIKHMHQGLELRKKHLEE